MAKKTANDQDVMNQREELTDIENTQTEIKDMLGKKSKKSSTEKLETEIDELQIEKAEMKDKFLRLFAEFENFKKRTFKEKLDLMKTAAQETMLSLLPVLDDFDRAKQSNDDDAQAEEWSDGVHMVYSRLNTALSAKGLKAMESNGEVFDPEFHEAITEIPAPNEELKGKVIDTVEKGYFLNDKLIRHAKVVVGK